MPDRRFATALLVALLAACGGPSPQDEAARRQSSAMQEASVRVGDHLVRANAVPTSTLGEAVARQYGVRPDPGTMLLLVGVRRLDGDVETAVPARVTVTAVNLLGRRQAPEVREVRVGEFIDYVVLFRVDAPDTLRFDVKATVAEGATASLQFNRDFYPVD